MERHRKEIARTSHWYGLLKHSATKHLKGHTVHETPVFEGNHVHGSQLMVHWARDKSDGLTVGRVFKCTILAQPMQRGAEGRKM